MPPEGAESTGAPREHSPANGHAHTGYDVPFSERLGKLWKKIVGCRHETSLKDALVEVLEEHESADHPVSSEEKTLLRNMLAFGELTAADIMVPRPDILAVESTIGLHELKKKFNEMRHTRLPVFGDTLDHILGFVHLKDLLPYLEPGMESAFRIDQVLRSVLFIPPSTRIIDLLLKMRVSGCHIAIVVDEYGGTNGMLTMEDVVEEIVGEIHDEHDDTVISGLQFVSERVIDADARVTVEEVEKVLQLDIGDDVDTLGGVIFSHLGRVPAKGEVVEMPHGVKMEILSADPRRIRRVRIYQPKELDSATMPHAE